ncbi:MAG: dihydroorotate dehydrogenase electron transfer subunit [Candidatus Omnitrophica bacterium]|nr:dihydroorotate dehydrogenase electron transfer subunit [Candidatus Omnitrophota bacterium]MBU1997751.1 dihydroorotate dehydrogenase electron transfer subunit [Candidatus Omnitrophota bacterium]MBU4334234.1 dihydroorotate dehydrogenase electron transfer subunit [Candidatus Omnitrophota bacterium]
MYKNQYKAKIVSNEKLTAKLYRMSLDAGKITEKVVPGQFIHIRINDTLKPFFRRPFSIYRAKNNIEILYEVVGDGTRMLSSKKNGEVVDVIGPLGKGFSLPSKKIKQVIMIGGGVGVAPFLALSDELKKIKCEQVLLYGGRTKEHIFNMKEYKANGCKVSITTDDGSVGIKGRVSKLYSKINTDPERTFIYTCGPKPMMASVKEFAQKHGIDGQVSCEEVMACGVGACKGCSIDTSKGYKTVCFDGPVFNIKDIKF